MMNRLLDLHREAPYIPSSMYETLVVTRPEYMITSPNKGVKIFGQFLKDERVYVNQLERTLDLLFVVQQVKEFACLFDIYLSLDSILDAATRLLCRLDSANSVHDVIDAAEVLDAWMVSEYDRDYSRYHTYLASDKALVTKQFSDIRDYVLRHYADMSDMVQTEHVFFEYLLLPSSRWAGFLTFVNVRILSILRCCF